jgi:erythromycin esterase
MWIFKVCVATAVAAVVLLVPQPATAQPPPNGKPPRAEVAPPPKAKLTPAERAQQAEVKKWLAGQAITLKSVEASNGFKDMEPLKKVVGQARIVSLGEATHGTREFFQFKHRMLEFLVSEMDFNIFAIEATMPEGFDVNEYVLTGKGDPVKALAGLYFWCWDTEEVLDMIRWMRAYNADPQHTKKVKFYGFDMQSSPRAARQSLAYMHRVDPKAAAEHVKSLAVLANAFLAADVEGLAVEKKKELTDAAKAFLKRFDEHKDDYTKRTSAAEWAVARQHAQILVQFCEMNIFGVVDFAGSLQVRDRAMADNVQWILEHEGPRAKAVLWAHNGHVETGDTLVAGDMTQEWKRMGHHLRKKYGRDMVVFGFAFNQGGFRAVDSLDGSGKGLRPFDVDPAPAGSLDAMLATSGHSLAAWDLRTIPKDGPVAAWFNESHVTRDIGAVYIEEAKEQFYVEQKVQNLYDALIFVEKTSTARGNKRAVQAVKSTRPGAPINLGFEDGEAGKLPPGWRGPIGLAASSYETLTTTDDPHTGKRCVMIRSTPGPRYGEYYGHVAQIVDAAPYRGQKVRLRAAVRTDVAGFGNQAHLWLEVLTKESRPQTAPLDIQSARAITTPKWKEIEIVRDVPKEADVLTFGLALVGEGRAWLDSVSLEVVDK